MATKTKRQKSFHRFKIDGVDYALVTESRRSTADMKWTNRIVCGTKSVDITSQQLEGGLARLIPEGYGRA